MLHALVSRRKFAALIAICVVLHLPFTGGLLAQAPDAKQTETVEPGRAYLQAFRRHLDLMENDLSHIAALADGVADCFLERKYVRVGRHQGGFYTEYMGRASGPTWTRGRRGGWDNDIAMMGISGCREPWRVDPNELMKAADTKVIIFANRRHLGQLTYEDEKRAFQPSDFYGFVDNHVGPEEFAFQIAGRNGQETLYTDIASVINTLNGWIFIGELTAASTRRGKMPAYWLSFGIDKPRGYARAMQYTRRPGRRSPQKLFHDDLNVPPVAPEWIGKRYLEHMRSYVFRLETWSELEEASDRITAALRRGNRVYFCSIGHNFPYMIPSQERDDPLTIVQMSKLDELLETCGEEGDVLFMLLMPTYDEFRLESALKAGMEVIVASTAPPTQTHRKNEKLYWIPTAWPMADGCVEIPGYDIPLLPVSGVMNSVMYFSVRSQVEYNLAKAEVEATTPKQAEAPKPPEAE